MRKRMTKFLAAVAAAALAQPALAAAPPAAPAAEEGAEAGALREERKPAAEELDLSFVQQGLTIHELEKELERLKAYQAETETEIAALSADLERQQQRLKVRKEAAGRVLRAYYMGQRDKLWLLLFEVRSLNEALAALDYLQAVWVHDNRTLERYREAYEQSAALLAELNSRRDRLDFLIGEYETQRARKLEEQAELDRRLTELAEEERNRQIAAIEAARSEWEEIGVPLFEDVLAALSGAMTELPNLLTDPSLIAVVDGGLEFRLTDTAFNAFLQEQDPIFETFRFRFSPEGMAVSGELNEKTASLGGRYILLEEPENALHFIIDSIWFNGVELPDTTKAALQQQYDLTFEPGLLVSGLSVSELIHEEGMVRVKLALSLFGGNSSR